MTEAYWKVEAERWEKIASKHDNDRREAEIRERQAVAERDKYKRLFEQTHAKLSSLGVHWAFK